MVRKLNSIKTELQIYGFVCKHGQIFASFASIAIDVFVLFELASLQKHQSISGAAKQENQPVYRWKHIPGVRLFSHNLFQPDFRL